MRSEIACDVKFGGRTESYYDGEGRYRVRWAPEKVVKGVVYETPVPAIVCTGQICCACGKPKPRVPLGSPPSHRFAISLASSIRAESMAEGVARIWW